MDEPKRSISPFTSIDCRREIERARETCASAQRTVAAARDVMTQARVLIASTLEWLREHHETRSGQ